jgi:hypothetical protein
MAVRRIRTPHPHDVLCGRGGGINGHVGNRVFRDLVAERRLDYNLASSKSEKARVAKEVMNLVTGLSPPGRFLMRDPTGGIGSWWIEIDENKAMAKTSQALREGAPSIRAQHQDDLKTITRNSGSKRARSYDVGSTQKAKKFAMMTPSPLMSNAQFNQELANKSKMQPKTVTPTLIPSTDTSDIPPLFLEPVTVSSVPAYTESTSDWKILADNHLGEFINPFENEEGIVNPSPSAQELCMSCGSSVQCGKMCTCLSSFDPLHEMSTL